MSVPVGVVIAERLEAAPSRIVTPLGIRFRDVALDRPITDGLVVLARSKQLDAPPRRLVPNPSGVFGFHELPLLHAFEYPAPDGSSSAPVPGSFSYVVMVADTLGRFLPVVFSVDLPLAGLTSPPVFDLDPDPAPVLDAYLFSAPTRAVTAGFAAVRADLWDEDADAPASHALVRATLGGRSILGLADEQGRVLILMPYPVLARLRLGSPPGTGQRPPSEQSFPLSIEISYQPDLPRPFGAAAVLPAPWDAMPGLKGILESQGPVWIWPTLAGPAVTVWTGDVTYDRELVVFTGTTSRLSISRGASPP
jgi:hypothetical protein